MTTVRSQIYSRFPIVITSMNIDTEITLRPKVFNSFLVFLLASEFRFSMTGSMTNTFVSLRGTSKCQ